MENQCAICGKPAMSFNYGVQSCNACKMFFRRSMEGLPNVDFHENSECSNVLKCRQCRFTKCLELGMRAKEHNFQQIAEVVPLNLTKLVEELSAWDKERFKILMDYNCPEDPNLTDLISSFPKFQIKTEKLHPADWGFMEQMSTLDFLQKFPISKYLNSADIKIFYKTSCFRISSFIKSFRQFTLNIDELQYPNGFGIVPNELIPFCHVDFLKNVRSRLIGRVIELNIREEEFLLLIAVLVCNPAANNYSNYAKTIIASFQKIYSSALMQYCLIHYQQGGPARFSELLSIYHVINKHVEDVNQLCFLFTFVPQRIRFKQICAEVLMN